MGPMGFRFNVTHTTVVGSSSTTGDSNPDGSAGGHGSQAQSEGEGEGDVVDKAPATSGAIRRLGLRGATPGSNPFPMQDVTAMMADRCVVADQPGIEWHSGTGHGASLVPFPKSKWTLN
jgi:hypothetical protein